MLKTLYLLRHAKSDWADPSLPDRERPLSARGRRAARRVGRLIATARPRPAVVLCSPALRARATWEAVAAALSAPVELHVEEDLYAAGAGALLSRIRRLPEQAEAAMIVGHNPGLHELTRQLAGDGEAAAMRQLDEKFPTGALATLDLPDPWSQAGRGSCYLQSLVLARDLPG